MKKFKITVNNKAFEVEVEELGVETAAAPVAVAAPVAAPKAAAPAPVAPKAPAPVKKVAATGNGTVTAPMNGTIFKHKAKVGDTVKAGDVVIILEAMKMENDIVANKDGVIKEMPAAEGVAVAPGDVLVVIE